MHSQFHLVAADQCLVLPNDVPVAEGASAFATGATIAFDAVGGGRLADQILKAMEVAAGKRPQDL